MPLEFVPVEFAEFYVPAEPFGGLDLLGHFGSEHHELLGHAAAQDTGTARSVFFGNRDLQPQIRRQPRGANAAGARADDKQIIIEFGHVPISGAVRACCYGYTV